MSACVCCCRNVCTRVWLSLPHFSIMNQDQDSSGFTELSWYNIQTKYNKDFIPQSAAPFSNVSNGSPLTTTRQQIWPLVVFSHLFPLPKSQWHTSSRASVLLFVWYGVQNCVFVHVQQSGGTCGDTRHLPIIHTRPLTVQHTHAALAPSGTAFQSLIYCPIICLLCCIYRPFTERIYQERSQRRKHE